MYTNDFPYHYILSLKRSVSIGKVDLSTVENTMINVSDCKRGSKRKFNFTFALHFPKKSLPW